MTVPENDPNTGNQNPAGGGDGLGWRAALPADLQNHEGLTKFKEVKDLGKSYVELEGKLGNALFIPGNEATDEERSAFFTKLGRPEKAEDYVIAEMDVQGITDEKVREAIKARATEDITWFRGVAHKLGMSKGVAESLFSEYAKRNAEYFAQVEGQRQKAMDDAMDALKKDPEWAGENFQKNLVVVNKAMEAFGSPELKQIFDASGLGNNAAFVKFFYQVGKAMGEDKLVGGAPGGSKDKKGWSYPSMEDK